MAKLRLDLEAQDRASATINKVAENAKTAAQKMIANDKELSKTTEEVSKAKKNQLTLSQRTKLAVLKESAAGNKLKLSIVARKEELWKAERALKEAIKTGGKNAAALAKETVKLRKNVKALESKTEAQDKAALSAKGLAKVLAAGAAVVAGAAAGVFLLTKRYAENADQMIKSAVRVGLTVEQYQKLDHAMKISGTSVEEQKGALTRFARTARDASEGVKIAEDAFTTLGVSVKGNDGKFKDMNTLLLETADQYRKMPASVGKTAVAMDLFGRSGAALTQFLNLGKVGIAELGIEAEELGNVLSLEAAQGAEEFVDALTRMEAAGSGIAKSFSGEATPVITRGMEQIAVSLVRLRAVYGPVFEQFGKDAEGWGRVTVPVVGFIGKAFVGLGTTVLVVWEGIKATINEKLSGVMDMFNSMIRMANKARAFFGQEQGEEFFNPFKITAKENLKHIKDIMEASAASMAEIDKIGEALLGNTSARTGPLKEEIDLEKKLLAELRARWNAQKKEEPEAEAKKEKKAKKAKKEKPKKDPKIEAITKQHREWIGVFPQLQAASAEQRDAFISDMQAQIDAGIQFGNVLSQQITGAMAIMTDETATQEEKMKALLSNMIAALEDWVTQTVTLYAKSAAGAAFFQGMPGGPAAALALAALTFGMAQTILTMQKGGLVPGAGVGDRVPALLEPGELVIPRDLTSRILAVGGRSGSGGMKEGGVVSKGGAGVVVNINEGGIIPRSPAELDRFVRDKLVPTLTRLKQQGAYA